MLLRFFGFGIFAFQIGESHVQRFVTESNTNGVHGDAFFVQGIGVGLTKAVKFSAFDTSFLCNRLQLAQKVSIGFSLPVRKDQILPLGILLSHSVLNLPEELGRDW